MYIFIHTTPPHRSSRFSQAYGSPTLAWEEIALRGFGFGRGGAHVTGEFKIRLIHLRGLTLNPERLPAFIG